MLGTAKPACHLSALNCACIPLMLQGNAGIMYGTRRFSSQILRQSSKSMKTFGQQPLNMLSTYRLPALQAVCQQALD